jgi:hypothetical protein
MQGVDAMHREIITLFNFHKQSGKWYTTLFQGVTLLELKGETATGAGGQTNADSVEAIIHVSPDKAYDGKTYVGAKEYKEMAVPEEHFTFLAGTDFFMAGDYRMEPVLDDDYDEGLYHEMNRTYDGVYMVTSAAFYGLLPHFEIGGR